MRKIFIITLLLLLSSFYSVKGQSAGSDVIFLLDNSGSISNIEYEQMKVSTQKLIEKILNCNTKNRVSVIHYGTDLHNGSLPNPQPRIWIESDFTNNLTTATNFDRRLNVGDHLHEATGLIGNALDHITNLNIVSPQKVLNQLSSNSLVLFVFTDGFRGVGGDLVGGSFLVNFYSNSLNSNNAFQNFTEFKNVREAKFVVTHVSPDATSTAAGAAIASLGGAHNNPIESYPADPDGSGQGPRMYLLKNNFILTSSEIDLLTDLLCSISNEQIIDFAFEPICAFSETQYNVWGNINLPVGGTMNTLQMFLRDISTGIEYSVNSAPTISGGQFNFVFDYFDINIPAPFAGQYQMVVKLDYSVGGLNYNTQVFSDYFYDYNYLYELDFNCCPFDLVLTVPVASGTTDIQIASNGITASNTIENGAEAIYTAGNYIDLIPGFDSQLGSNFFAFIEGCIPATTTNENIPFEYRFSNGNNIDEYASKEISKNKITISPNPVEDQLFIISASEIKNVTIIDIMGKRRAAKVMDNTVDVTNLERGTYIINIQTEKGTTSEKFIKK